MAASAKYEPKYIKQNDWNTVQTMRPGSVKNISSMVRHITVDGANTFETITLAISNVTSSTYSFLGGMTT